MPNTQQRKVIVSVLKESGRPLARKEILALGRQKLPSLGAATVNRAIRKMTEHFDYNILFLSFYVFKITKPSHAYHTSQILLSW